MTGPRATLALLPADPAGAVGRRLRAVVFAAVSVGLAALAHIAGGDRLPPWWLLLGALWAVQLAATPLAARERGLAWLLAATVAVQIGLHVVFATAMTRPGSGMAGMPGMSAGDPLMSSARAWCGHGPASSMSLLPRAGWMLGAHIVAALLVGAWLRRGERRFFATAARWADQARTVVEQALDLALATIRVLGITAFGRARGLWTHPATSTSPRVMTGRVLVGGLALRGPPSPLAA